MVALVRASDPHLVEAGHVAAHDLPLASPRERWWWGAGHGVEDGPNLRSSFDGHLVQERDGRHLSSGVVALVTFEEVDQPRPRRVRVAVSLGARSHVVCHAAYRPRAVLLMRPFLCRKFSVEAITW